MGLLTFTVKPNIPAPLAPLEELSRNLWISWNYPAILLFMRLDQDAWLASRQSPSRMLGLVPQERLDEAAADDSYLAALSAVYGQFKRYLAAERWYKGPTGRAIAYFSMEYGIDVSLPVYSGGLGVLSGDHLKTSSDLGLPLVGVGLLYRQGYFQQYLNADGFQQESYPENDWYNMPVALCRDAKGEPVTVSVDLAGEKASAWVWEVRVGKCPLYLLDTNIEANPASLRQITASLYGGDRENRIRQEILLGIGGIRALDALGITPAVTHMNEGHSAFLGIERIRSLVKGSKLSFAEALQAVWATSVFTTHTPVPAGNERFAPELVEKYFRSTAQELGLSWKDFLALGRERADDDAEEFCLTVLALRLSARANGVSRLHGEVSRGMWRRLWPGLPLDEVPIGHVTNGVHPRTWIAHDLVDLLDRYLGPGFHDEPTNLAIWDRLDRVSDEELWRTHERRRERLVAFVRARLREQLVRRGATNSELAGLRGRALAVRAHGLLRPAVRHLQAGRPAAVRPRAAPPPAHRRAAPPAADLRGQGAPPRPRGQGDHPQARALRRRPARAEPGGLPRGLRHDHRALPRVGQRRVAEHAPPAPGGERHQRHEGRDERGAQRLDPRRLVGRGVRRPARLVGRTGRAVRGPEAAGRHRGHGALRPARARGGAAVLHPGHRRPAARVDPTDEGVDAGNGEALQLPPDAARIRRALLPARRWRRTPGSPTAGSRRRKPWPRTSSACGAAGRASAWRGSPRRHRRS